MSAAHPLTVRLADLRLRVTLWAVALLAGPLVAGGSITAWLLAGESWPTLWAKYQFSSLLAAMGASDFLGADIFLFTIADRFPAIADAWRSDFLLIGRAAGATFALIAAALFFRLAWPALAREREV